MMVAAILHKKNQTVEAVIETDEVDTSVIIAKWLDRHGLDPKLQNQLRVATGIPVIPKQSFDSQKRIHL